MSSCLRESTESGGSFLAKSLLNRDLRGSFQISDCGWLESADFLSQYQDWLTWVETRDFDSCLGLSLESLSGRKCLAYRDYYLIRTVQLSDSQLTPKRLSSESVPSYGIHGILGPLSHPHQQPDVALFESNSLRPCSVLIHTQTQPHQSDRQSLTNGRSI